MFTGLEDRRMDHLEELIDLKQIGELEMYI